MLALPYWQVDAFAARTFAGNPAAVVECAAGLPDATMQAVAAELGLPATAFVTPAASGPAIRWFSPVEEIALCGHGTLSAGHVLLSLGDANSVVFIAADGRELEVRRAINGYELALPAIAAALHDLPGLAGALGARPVETRWHPDGYALAIFARAQQVEDLKPDFAALAALGHWQVTASAPGDPGDTEIVSRVFTRTGGEDSVTGSAHAALAPYWAERLGREAFRARQASARGGLLDCRLDGSRVWLGGECVTVAEGRFYLSG